MITQTTSQSSLHCHKLWRQPDVDFKPKRWNDAKKLKIKQHPKRTHTELHFKVFKSLKLQF